MRLINFIICSISLIKWNIIFFFKYLTERDFRKIIGRNKNIHNSHLGERCFIVGNGPSLKSMNLDRLKDEYVFTVNTIYRNDSIFKTINANCHLVMDPGFLIKNSEKFHEISKCIKKYNPNILLITEYYQDNKFCSYFNNHLYQIFSHRYSSSDIKIDFCRNMAPTQNVVQTAIYTAIYMGFKEIYLVGCDMTAFYENLQANVGNFESFHAYELTKEDKNSYSNVKDLHDNTFVLHDYAITFDIFKNIKKYCIKNNIRLFNATDGGILDMFPRICYNSLFK